MASHRQGQVLSHAEAEERPRAELVLSSDAARRQQRCSSTAAAKQLDRLSVERGPPADAEAEAPAEAQQPSMQLGAAAPRVGRIGMDTEADGDFGLAPGQKYGPTSPAHLVAPGDL